MKEDKRSFIVYSDIKENLDDMTDTEVATLFRAMVDYSLTGEEPELDRFLKHIFMPVRRQMDRDREKWTGIKEARSRAGKLGGAKKGNQNAKKDKTLQDNDTSVIKNKQNKQSQAKQAKQAVNVNVNDNVNVNVNVNDNVIQLSSALLSRMGGNASQDFEPDVTVQSNIAGLLNEGYTEDDMFEVVDAAWLAWKDDKANITFYNPQALFGDMFRPLRRQLDDINRQKAQAERRAE